MKGENRFVLFWLPRLFDWCRSIDDGADLPRSGGVVRCRLLRIQRPRFSLHAANYKGCVKAGFRYSTHDDGRQEERHRCL